MTTEDRGRWDAAGKMADAKTLAAEVKRASATTDEAVARMQAEWDAKYGCPDCKTRMEYVCGLEQGDEEARGSTSLYQCPKCKTVRECY